MHRFALVAALCASSCFVLPRSVPIQARGEEVLRIPSYDLAGRRVVLIATFYRPAGPGPFPLIVINHGSPRHAEDRIEYERLRYPEQSQWFLDRGFAVLVPMRSGFGASGGNFEEGMGPGHCAQPDYLRLSTRAARDVAASISYVVAHEPVDPTTVVLVGHSAGALASLALASAGFPGIRGVVSFAGGCCSHGPHRVCAPDQLIALTDALGESVRVPTLWIYAENDLYFSPELAVAMWNAFVEAGGEAQLEIVPPFGEDGHGFFTQSKPEAWSAHVMPFLQKVVPTRDNPRPLR